MSNKKIAQSKNSILLDIDGMKCGSCVLAVEKILKSHPNTINASVNLVTKTAFLEIVKFNKSSKELTFKQLYGGVFKQYEHLEYFKKISIYIRELWDKFQSDGFVKCPVSNFVYSKENLDEMNPQKLFNYLLQNFLFD